MSETLPRILEDLLEFGDEVGSRNGRVREFLNPQIVITDPVKREVLSLHRGANVFAQIAETMWVLDGRDDIQWLSAYLPRARDYSDDGQTWRGAYGPRIRTWGHIDQLAHVMDLLASDPLTRRAVISIYNPTVDTAPGKDIPCNDFLQFQNRGGALHLTVTVRSNDAMWGWSGINAFEWSTLQEIVASLLGIKVGNLVFNIGSLHLYDRHWARASNIKYQDPSVYGLRPSPRFNPDGVFSNLEELDLMLDRWFVWEGACRSGEAAPDWLDEWEDPLFKSWAQAIAYYWTRDTTWLADLHGTALGLAIARTPASVLSEAPQTSRNTTAGAGTRPPSNEAVRAFYYFVRDLHATKHASYGDSWKKRGEKMSILANIARKVDRLGVGDEYDSSADTVIDLFVYLAKYSYWIHGLDDGPENVNLRMSYILGETQEVSTQGEALDITFADVLHAFDDYTDRVDDLGVQAKSDFLDGLMRTLAPIARDLWLAEQGHTPLSVDEYRGADTD